jgi:hypothetical protein
MAYQVSPGDPIVSLDVAAFEKAIAIHLKASGVTTSVQLATILSNIIQANNTGMSVASCALLQTVGAIISMVP